jgi:V/A-type H+-transporting ATPase subunit I
VRQIHGVLRAIGILPGYGEPDVSPLFLVFLVLFASMLIGDAGYGALILLAVALVRWRMPRADRQTLRLLTTLGCGTVAWGVLTGTWFALQDLPSALLALRIDWLAGGDPQASARNVMLLCFLLGAVHLTLAHLWAALRTGWKLAALAQLGWVATTWTMFFAARAMVLGAPFPALATVLAVLGIATIALFMTPLRQLRDEWFNHVMLPLSLVSNFVDVVSYLRLFAVGTAGVAVAGAFNEMAARVAESGPLGWLFAALVAVFGHSLNLLLCAMGVLVHGVRLNTLEFSAHLGLQWSGIPYAPLARRRADPGADSSGTVVNTTSSG